MDGGSQVLSFFHRQGVAATDEIGLFVSPRNEKGRLSRLHIKRNSVLSLFLIYFLDLFIDIWSVCVGGQEKWQGMMLENCVVHNTVVTVTYIFTFFYALLPYSSPKKLPFPPFLPLPTKEKIMSPFTDASWKGQRSTQ